MQRALEVLDREIAQTVLMQIQLKQRTEKLDVLWEAEVSSRSGAFGADGAVGRAVVYRQDRCADECGRLGQQVSVHGAVKAAHWCLPVREHRKDGFSKW